jgi:hypothetical protein
MARPRNAIEYGMPPEVREAAYRAIYASLSNAEIAKAVADCCARLGIKAPKVHGTTVQAVRERSAEYAEYVSARREWDQRTSRRRWAASAINEGAGPRSLADMAEMAILEQLHDLAEGGVLETGKDIATVARAITSLQRTQLARAEAAKDETIAQLKKQHETALAEKDAQIARLRGQLEQASGSANVDAGRVQAAMDEILGVK